MNADEIKSALNPHAEEFARWLFPAGKKRGQEWMVGSLQGESGQSLCICIGGPKIGVFADFATGEKGDNLLDLYIQAKQIPFKDALQACADWLGVSIANHLTVTPNDRFRSKPVPASPLQPFPAEEDLLSVSQCREAVRMVTALRDDPKRCEQIALARGWKIETIQKLTREPSLGWYEGKLVFVYETGVKFRWREKGERIIKWAFGKPWIWRGTCLHIAQTVFIAEGETDAISLIDAGVEERPDTFVVALPSASAFNARWVGPFRDKDVILALDADDAGIKATARVSQLLAPHVRSLKQLNWGAVQYASAS